MVRALLILVSVISVSCPDRVRAQAGGFDPDSDGWIRHWVVYGPLGTHSPRDSFGRDELFDPFTFEPVLLFDLIAETEGTPDRQTEQNFRPEPGKEIATEFGRLLPDHILREGAGAGINPNEGLLMGIGWVDRDCTVNFDEVFDFRSVQNGHVGSPDIRGYVAYAYTYVELTGDEPLEVFPSFDSDDASQVLLGPVPAEPGEDFMEPGFLANVLRPPLSFCGEANGPEAPDETSELTLEPGMNLLLVKVLEATGRHAFRFRFRHTDPDSDPPFAPVTGDQIRIRLRPDVEAPDPVLFVRMDVDGDGRVALTDAVRTLGALFGGGEKLGCPDAADADDNGEVNLSDAVLGLQHLFQGGAELRFPNWCGLDPTWDELPECAEGSGC